MIEIDMKGSRNGAKVWFDPIGIHVQPGQTIRWANRDKGNTHTATAYHPVNLNHPRRIPAAAKPWDSGFLLPGKMFSVTLTKPGVYDYFCIPHEAAGMVGRIVVGDPGTQTWNGKEGTTKGLPTLAIGAFPSIEEILENGIVRRA